MSDCLDKVSAFIDRHQMLKGARGVVVAVSGGADSVALLDLLLQWREAEGLAEVVIRVAHLNHHLRGADSEEDAAFVAALAASLDVPATIHAADVRAATRSLAKGIEETARELRYHFLLEVARSSGCGRIATGHTMNDQAETVLMRLARGSGLRGLAGMRPVAPLPVGEQEDNRKNQDEPVPLIRPLLCLTRAEVEEYCRARNLRYRTDATNFDPQFARNRIRHGALPVLEKLNPRAVEAISRAAENLAAENDVLDEVAGALLKANAAQIYGSGDQADGAIGYPVEIFRTQPAGLRWRMFARAIGGLMLGGLEKPAEIGTAHAQALEAFLEKGTSGKRVALPGGIEAWREFEFIVFRRVSAGAKPAAYSCELGPRSASVEAGGVVLAMQRGLSAAELPELLEEARRDRREHGRDWLFAALDDEALPPALVVRPRRRGERGVIFGHRQTIKLKKLMIDHRIPASRRALWPVVTTPDGRYIWSPGLPPAVDFAARDETRAIAIVRALNL